VDSLCQTLIRERVSAGARFKNDNKVADFDRKVDGKSDFNFADYRLLLEGEFMLSSRHVNLNPYEDAFYGDPTMFAPDDVSGYLIAPFEAWAAGSALTWWQAFTNLKHDRLTSFREATLRNVIWSLAANFILLTIRNETQFKKGRVSTDLYQLFLPKYWQWSGRVMPGNFVWR
jgi:hypothetical protein